MEKLMKALPGKDDLEYDNLLAAVEEVIRYDELVGDFFMEELC